VTASPTPDKHPGRVVELPHYDPPEAPLPAKGCDICGALAQQRAEARERGDMSRVTDCNVEMRRHPHPHPHSHEKRRGKR